MSNWKFFWGWVALLLAPVILAIILVPLFNLHPRVDHSPNVTPTTSSFARACLAQAVSC